MTKTKPRSGLPRRSPTPVRLNDRERDLITKAAELLGVSLSEFLRTASISSAKNTIAKLGKEPNA